MGLEHKQGEQSGLKEGVGKMGGKVLGEFSGSTGETKTSCEKQRGRIGVKIWDTNLKQESEAD